MSDHTRVKIDLDVAKRLYRDMRSISVITAWVDVMLYLRHFCGISVAECYPAMYGNLTLCASKGLCAYLPICRFPQVVYS